jgi:lysophospholipase L1-like esterase
MLKKIVNIALMLFSIFICLFMAEVFLRLFAPQIVELRINYEWQTEDKVLPYVPKPSYTGRMVLKDQFDVGMNINSAGFRGKEDISLKKDLREKRIAFIGDSFTFGWGVEDEEVYPYLVGKGIDKAYPEEKITILNAAVYGYDIVQYMEVFGRILDYSPDVIFLGFCLENDFNITPLKTEILPVERIKIEKRDAAYHIREFINHLHLVTMVRDRLYITFPKIRNLMLSLGINNKRDIFLEQYTPALKRSLSQTEMILVDMFETAKKRGIEFIVILIPLKEQIYCREEINNFEGYDIDSPNKVLGEILERNDIKYMDILPSMLSKSIATDKRLYFDVDPHWTRYGHAVAAGVIIEEYMEF